MFRLIVPAILLSMMACPFPAFAQTLLRWKLKPGDALTVEIKQDTDSTVGFSAKSAKSEIHLTLNLLWNVTATNNDGITIRQTVERIHEIVATQDAGTIEFDSAASSRPTGQARELAESLKPLIGAEFELLMNPRGDITSVKPANDVAKALLGPVEKTGQEAATQEALQQLLRRPLVVLPEKPVQVGDAWSFASDRTTAAGQMKLETTYRLEKSDDPAVAKISMAAKAQPSAGSRLTIKSHDHNGTIFFSLAEGWPTQIEQTQKLVTERPYRETTITVTLSSTQKTTLRRQ